MKLILVFIMISFSILADVSEIKEAETAGVSLTERDREVLEIGRIDQSRKVTGGVLGSSIGFGIGHAVQGRWKDKGWIYTVGEASTLTIALLGASGCSADGNDDDDDDDDDWDYHGRRSSFRSSNSDSEDDSECSAGNALLLLAGVGGFIGFKVWEIIDVWSGAGRQNEHYDSLKNKIESKKAEPTTSLFLVPVLNRHGSGLGLVFNF